MGTFLANLRRLQSIVSDAGLQTALHPHWGMAIEKGSTSSASSTRPTVGFCLDTGHVYLAGTDPVEVARAAARSGPARPPQGRRPREAEQVRTGEVPFRQSVIDGLFVPLGQGGVDIAGVIARSRTTGTAAGTSSSRTSR